MLVGTALLNITGSDALSKAFIKLILLLLCDLFGLVTMKAAVRESSHHPRKLINTNHQEEIGSLAIQCKQRNMFVTSVIHRSFSDTYLLI